MDIDLKKNGQIDIKAQLKECVDFLKRYKTSYERISINISSELPEIEAKIDRNISSSLELRHILDTRGDYKKSSLKDELEKFNSELKSVINSLKESKEIDKSIFDDLRNTIDLSIQSVSKIKDIDNISENLKVFAINSIVYAQKAGTKGQGYQFISGQFIKLSEDLAKSTAQIILTGKKLNSYIIQLLESIEIHDYESSEHIDEITDESQSLIKNSNTSIETLLDILENIVNQIKEVKKPTSEIMFQIQRQDIIQQQMEHTFQIMDELSKIINSKSSKPEEELDILTLLNFLLLTTDMQIKRINSDLLSMIIDIEAPLNRIIETIDNFNKYESDVLKKFSSRTTSNITEIIDGIFQAPESIISDIIIKLDLNQGQKKELLSIFKNIDDLMKVENNMAKGFLPLMDMIQNLLFLAQVEQARNKLDINLDLESNNSVFSNAVFIEMDNIIEGINKSQTMVQDNLLNIRDSFEKQKKKYDLIKRNLMESTEFLEKTEVIFSDNFQLNVNTTATLFQEVNIYQNKFKELKELHSIMESQADIFSRFKRDVDFHLQKYGGAKNLNDTIFRSTIIQQIIDNLTVDSERTAIIQNFPELEIEKSVGSAVTFF